MVDIPSPKDTLVNLFMTLYVIFEATKRGEIDGRVKLMKLLQKAEEELTKRTMRGPSFVFYKWEHGAWSPEAQFDLELLARSGLVSENKERHLINPTKQGLELIKSSHDIIEKNRELLNVVNRTVASHVQYRSWQLKALTYATPSLEGERKLIGEIAKGEVVLRPIDESKASKFFLIDDDWLDMLSMLASNEFREMVSQVKEQPDLAQYAPLKLLRKEYGLE
jgi:hypothetical protein